MVFFMNINRPQAKQAARDLMRTARTSPYQVGLLYVVIVLLLNAADTFTTRAFAAPYFFDFMNEAYVLYLPSGIAWFVAILVALITTVLNAGFACYCLGIRRGKEMPLTSLFDGFSMAGKIILLEIVMYIFVCLWSLLLIIPGIIATYRYRFALYNLLENPDIGIMDAIKMSKEQTRGFKWQLFVLDLSFLGWQILALFTFDILYLWLAPYMKLADIAFYDAICAHKGMGGSDWADGAADHAPVDGQFDHDWNAQSGTWNAPTGQDTSRHSAPDGAPQQDDAPGAYHYGDAPKAPDVPSENASRDAWEQNRDESDPWNRGNKE